MDALKVVLRGEEMSGPSSTQGRKRRASAITVRLQRRAPGADPSSSSPPAGDLTRIKDSRAAANRGFPEPDGTLLIVQDATERQRLVQAARLTGLQVLLAGNPEEALQILREKDCPVDLLLVLPPPAISTSAADLIRESLVIRPALRVLMMIESGRREEMRAGYDAGAASIILDSISTEGLTIFLKQSFAIAREDQRRELRRRERRERHASDSPARRGVRSIRSWVDAPSGSRRKAVLAAVATGAVALLMGMGLAFVLERSNRAGDLNEAMTNRILEGMNRSRGSTGTPEAAFLRRQMVEQTGLTREANEATRQYYLDHLRELRWQNDSRRSTPSAPVAPPTPERPR